jgi:TPR repeat protein
VPQSSSRSEKDQLLYVWKSNTQGIVEMAETLPEDQYDLRPQLPAEMSNGERVPTFAEVALAAAGFVYYRRAMVEGTKLPEGPPKREEFKNKAEVVAYVRKAFDEGTVLLEKADLSKPVQGPEGPIKGEQFWSDFVEGPANVHFGLLAYYRVMKWPLPPGEAARVAASREPPQEIKQFAAECEQNKYASCTGLGDWYSRHSDAASQSRATELYERACNGGDAAGCYSLGLQYEYRKYEHGTDNADDEARAEELLQRACNMGNADGCSSLDLRRTQARAVSLDQRKCDEGDPIGCVALATAYGSGNGVLMDKARALALYQQACERMNSKLGCWYLGSMYEKGQGVAKDELRAAALYQRTCDEGFANACSTLGAMYEYGHGVANDVARAVALYQQACDHGEFSDCELLAGKYEMGWGVAKDKARAMELYRMACDGGSRRGIPQACTKLKHPPK